MKRAAYPTIDVLSPAAGWTRSLPTAAAIVRRAAKAGWDAGASAAQKRRAKTTELSVLLTGDAAIRKLNALYRGKDKATNVLSFPAGADGPSDGGVLLGDVVIAYGTVVKEAKEAGKSLKDHLSHMVVHGVLHLLGYDHDVSSDAKTMERLETKILAGLGIQDPYRDTIPEPAPKKTSRGARRRT
ncbi:MAG: rRNA maturation RNase YbeY [Proteobacteria bacterium]|nr:rRNA maturation RNase YbeY [Pseudomonadota bacterium]